MASSTPPSSPSPPHPTLQELPYPLIAQILSYNVQTTVDLANLRLLHKPWTIHALPMVLHHVTHVKCSSQLKRKEQSFVHELMERQYESIERELGSLWKLKTVIKQQNEEEEGWEEAEFDQGWEGGDWSESEDVLKDLDMLCLCTLKHNHNDGNIQKKLDGGHQEKNTGKTKDDQKAQDAQDVSSTVTSSETTTSTLSQKASPTPALSKTSIVTTKNYCVAKTISILFLTTTPEQDIPHNSNLQISNDLFHSKAELCHALCQAKTMHELETLSELASEMHLFDYTVKDENYHYTHWVVEEAFDEDDEEDEDIIDEDDDEGLLEEDMNSDEEGFVFAAALAAADDSSSSSSDREPRVSAAQHLVTIAEDESENSLSNDEEEEEEKEDEEEEHNQNGSDHEGGGATEVRQKGHKPILVHERTSAILTVAVPWQEYQQVVNDQSRSSHSDQNHDKSNKSHLDSSPPPQLYTSVLQNDKKNPDKLRGMRPQGLIYLAYPILSSSSSSSSSYSPPLPTIVHLEDDTTPYILLRVPIYLHVHYEDAWEQSLPSRPRALTFQEAFQSHARQDIKEGVAIVDGAVSPSLQTRLMREIDRLAASTQDNPDYHPYSKNRVRDLVHPALYSYVKGVSVVKKGLLDDEVPPAELRGIRVPFVGAGKAQNVKDCYELSHHEEEEGEEVTGSVCSEMEGLVLAMAHMPHDDYDTEEEDADQADEDENENEDGDLVDYEEYEEEDEDGPENEIESQETGSSGEYDDDDDDDYDDDGDDEGNHHDDDTNGDDNDFFPNPISNVKNLSQPKDYWGRPYEDSIYQWLPTYFHIDPHGRCTIQDYINNLTPRSQYTALYALLEELFATALPLLESVFSYARLARRDMRGGEEEDGETLSWNDEPPMPIAEVERVSLKGQKLQVVTKIVDYEFTNNNPEDGSDNDEDQVYEGVWHVEGMSHEEIVATALYVLHRDEEIQGADISFQRAYYAKEASYLFTTVSQCRPCILDWMIDRGLAPLGRLETPQGRLVVFPNSHVHRVGKMTCKTLNDKAAKNSETDSSNAKSPLEEKRVLRRRIVVFFLVNPAKRIVSTREVPPQQEEAGGAMIRAEAKKHRLCLMKERKMTKQDWNVRHIELCEH